MDNVKFNIVQVSLYEQINPKLKNEFMINKSSNREPVILVTGFWPPTNEMIRHFSQKETLNPNGWEGENWELESYKYHTPSP